MSEKTKGDLRIPKEPDGRPCRLWDELVADSRLAVRIWPMPSKSGTLG